MIEDFIVFSQYPGVAQSIDSDIDNLMSILNFWKILPEGTFITGYGSTLYIPCIYTGTCFWLPILLPIFS